MRKPELIAAVAANTMQSKTEVERTLNGLLEVITGTLAKGEEVQLVGFGSFVVKERAERTGRNPKTGEAMTIAGGKLPAFKAGKGLKDAVK